MTPDIATAKSMQQRALTKAAQNLIGICAGLTADGTINDLEIAFLQTWLADHQDVAATWPGNVINARIDDILADGVISDEERTHLLATLHSIAGNNFSETGSAAPSGPAAPIDEDAEIEFTDMTFCFTGEFIYGTRAACERAMLRIDAMPVPSVTGKLDYLVIGGMCSEHWANTTYGRKIETAIERRARYGRPLIITEEAWNKALCNHCGL